MTPRPPARLFLLPAKEKPVVIVLRRGPSRWVQVMKWNTLTDEIEHGSWFNGPLRDDSLDLSFDGKFMTYHVTGRDDRQWQGICQPPWLKTLAEGHVDGYRPPPLWINRNLLMAFDAEVLKEKLKDVDVPFQIKEWDDSMLISYDEIKKRQGWRFTKVHQSSDGRGLREWRMRPSKHHPELVAIEGPGHPTYSMPERLGIVDEQTTSAIFDCKGSLLTGRLGVLRRYRLEDLESGEPVFEFDTNALEAPKRLKRQAFADSDRLFVSLSPSDPFPAAVLGVDFSVLLTPEIWESVPSDDEIFRAKILPIEGQSYQYLASTSGRIAWNLLGLVDKRGLGSVALDLKLAARNEVKTMRSVLAWLESYPESNLRVIVVATDERQRARLNNIRKSLTRQSESLN